MQQPHGIDGMSLLQLVESSDLSECCICLHCILSKLGSSLDVLPMLGDRCQARHCIAAPAKALHFISDVHYVAWQRSKSMDMALCVKMSAVCASLES